MKERRCEECGGLVAGGHVPPAPELPELPACGTCGRIRLECDSCGGKLGLCDGPHKTDRDAEPAVLCELCGRCYRLARCEHLDPEDGTCGHPAASTPECHAWSDCPPNDKPAAKLRIPRPPATVSRSVTFQRGRPVPALFLQSPRRVEGHPAGGTVDGRPVRRFLVWWDFEEPEEGAVFVCVGPERAAELYAADYLGRTTENPDGILANVAAASGPVERFLIGVEAVPVFRATGVG